MGAALRETPDLHDARRSTRKRRGAQPAQHDAACSISARRDA